MVELATKCNVLRSELHSNFTARPASESHAVAASAQSPISHLGPRKNTACQRIGPGGRIVRARGIGIQGSAASLAKNNAAARQERRSTSTES